MQVTEIKSQVKRMFGDESGVQITDTDIVAWINAGQRQIVMQNEGLLEKTQVANSVGGQGEYAISSVVSDLLIFRGLMYKGPADVSYLRLKGYSMNQFSEIVDGWNSDTSTLGTPTMYTQFEEKLYLFPVPDVSSTAGIKIFYNRKPLSVTLDTDIPDLPELYHDTIINYCLMRAYELDENLEAAGAKGQQVDTDLKLLTGRDNWKNQETYPTITILEDDI